MPSIAVQRGKAGGRGHSQGMESVPRVSDELPVGSVDSSESKAAAAGVCCRLLSSWGKLDAGALQVEVISGGITNTLFKVTPPAQDGLPPLVVRIFGAGTEEIIDRQEELQRLRKLNCEGFGAKVLGTFGNGRLEEFLEGRIIEVEEMQQPETQKLVARRMANFHALMHVAASPECTLWTTLAKWMEIAKSLKFSDGAKQKAIEKLDLDSFDADIRMVQSVLEAMAPPVVLSHNDLLNGNIMLLADGKMQFIDFEYGGTNYRGFDFGNHFNEFAGFDCDYTRYPGPDVQRSFIREYLMEAAGSNAEPGDAEVEALLKETNVCALASHLFWGLWSVLQAQFSSIDFDFIEYAQLRYDEFKRRKDDFLAGVGVLLPESL